MGDRRAQAESVGVILLLFTIVVTASVAGVRYLAGVPSGDQRESTLAEFSTSATVSEVTITHAGGDSAALDSLTVVVRNNSATKRYAVDAANVSGDGDDRFEASERFARTHGLGGSTLTILVVHTPSNSIVARTTLDITNHPLVAAFTVTTANPVTGEPTGFDAAASRDEDGKIVAYRWTFDDGTTPKSGSTVSHTYSSQGTYPVTLTVENNVGETAATRKRVQVGNPTLALGGVALRDDGDGLVAPSDSMTVSTTVTSAGPGVQSVTADASAFDAGTVTLSDGDGDGTYEGTFTVGSGSADGDRSVTVTATATDGQQETKLTGTLTVDATGPTLSELSLSDSDGDGVVNTGDSVTVRADATDSPSGVATVTADASAFDAGTVSLSDGNNDGTYEGAFTVGEGATDGRRSATVTVTDNASNVASASMGRLRVDTTPPRIERFEVTDESFSFFVWISSYNVNWKVADGNLDSTTIYVNRTDSNSNPQATYTGSNGSETDSGIGRYDSQYEVKLRAIDVVGNERCVLITDPADGSPSDPITSFAPCS